MACLVIAGCGNTVDVYIVNRAVDICKDHGGVFRIVLDIGSRHVTCADGTIFTHLEQMRAITALRK